MTKRDNPQARNDYSSFWMVTNYDSGRWVIVTGTVNRTVTRTVTRKRGVASSAGGVSIWSPLALARHLPPPTKAKVCPLSGVCLESDVLHTAA